MTRRSSSPSPGVSSTSSRSTGSSALDPVAPLDDGDRAPAQELVETDVVQLLEMVEAIDVDVDERHPALVLADEREGGADDDLVDAERARDPLREHRLAHAEVTGQRDHVAGTQDRAHPGRERERLPRRPCACGQRVHGVRAPASARFTCTKSARACARRGAPVPQHRRRVQRGNEHRAVAERELLAPQLRDAHLGVEEQLRGEVAQRDDDRGVDELDLRLEVRTAAVDLERERVAVARRPALHDVRDVDGVAVEPDALDQAGEETAGAAHEGDAVAVLLLTRTLSHEHQAGVGIAGAEDHLGAGRRERAPGAFQRDAFQLCERCERQWFRRRFEQGHGTPVRLRRVRSGQCYVTADRTASAVTSVAMRRRRSRCASTSPVAAANAMSPSWRVCEG